MFSVLEKEEAENISFCCCPCRKAVFPGVTNSVKRFPLPLSQIAERKG